MLLTGEWITKDREMNNLTTIIITIVASSGFWTFLKEIIESKRKKKKPSEQMLLAIGRDRLLFLSKKYLAQGYIEEDDYECFTKLGDAYISLGGNSLVRKAYDQASKLPIK